MIIKLISRIAKGLYNGFSHGGPAAQAGVARNNATRPAHDFRYFLFNIDLLDKNIFSVFMVLSAKEFH
jgi:hypothetical protein